MRVDLVRKALYPVTVAAFIILFCGYTPAGAFDNEPIDNAVLLAQATQESANEQSETPRSEVLEEARENQEDEYDDEYDEDEDDEYADDEAPNLS